MQHDTFTKGDELYIYSKTTGYMKAWAGEDKPDRFGGLAYFKVTINSKALPGVSDMTINLNTFDAYLADNPEVLKKIAESFIQPEVDPLMEITEEQYEGLKKLFEGHAIDILSFDGGLTVKVWGNWYD